ncbi:MAG: hypothetical protein JOY94_12285 [Methylobacteriaceae bacterium]|nr:hypothetical protein [Methylobacteriaceae bacterium]
MAIKFGVAVFAACLVLAAGPALACKGKEVKFSDDFRQVDDSWGADPSSDAVTVEDGKVKVKAKVNGSYTLLYNGALFDDADICVTVQIPNKIEDPTQLEAALVFWAEDYNNLYALYIAPSGKATLSRLVNNKWHDVVPWRDTASVKTDPGAKNVLRVTTSGTQITAYINDVQFAAVRGQLPHGGGTVGLRAESEGTQRDAWKFIDLKVTDVAPQAAQ